jgi:hypothetical protein
MKNFENTSSNDTVLTGGLVAIAIAWVAFAALHAPAGDSAITVNAAVSAPASTATLRASASAPAAAVPAGRQPGAAGKVS